MNSKTAEFRAQIENVELSNEAKERISNGHRTLVLDELAHMDKGGDLLVQRPFILRPINGIVAVGEKNGSIRITDLPE